MKKTSLFSILFLLSITELFAQTYKQAMMKRMADSMRMVYLDAAAIQYPVLRQAFISTDIMGGGDVTGRLNGNDLFKAKIQLSRIKANFNLPIAQWGKNNLAASMGYLLQHTDISQVTSYNPQIPVSNSAVNTTIITFAASFTRMDSLFHHQVIYSANITGLTNELSTLRRVNEIAGINVPFKRTATSAFSVGLYYINDPTIPTHIIPFITYWHLFQTENIQLLADLPYRILLKKQLSPKSWVSFGSELAGSESFLALNQPLPHNSVSSTLELKTGPAFEYLVNKKIILGVSGGMFSTLSSKVFEQGSNPSDYFIKGSNNSVPYVNFSISFLPFLKAFSNR
jgi:hypothetical protein